MAQPTISVVTPVMNDVRVGRAIESILAQEYEPAPELIVIDGGSTDGTLSVLADYRKRIDVLISEPDDGIYDAMNKGIRRATGEVITILNADDHYVDSLVFHDMAQCLDGVDACYADIVHTNEKGNIVRYWRAGKPAQTKWFFGWMPPHPSFFVRRRVYERHGMFDLRYPVGADYEFMLRLAFKAGIDMRYMNRVIVRQAVGGNSSRIVRGGLDVWLAWKRNRLRGGSMASFFKPARKVWQFVIRP